MAQSRCSINGGYNEDEIQAGTQWERGTETRQCPSWKVSNLRNHQTRELSTKVKPYPGPGCFHFSPSPGHAGNVNILWNKQACPQTDIRARKDLKGYLVNTSFHREIKAQKDNRNWLRAHNQKPQLQLRSPNGQWGALPCSSKYLRGSHTQWPTAAVTQAAHKTQTRGQETSLHSPTRLPATSNTQ